MTSPRNNEFIINLSTRNVLSIRSKDPLLLPPVLASCLAPTGSIILSHGHAITYHLECGQHASDTRPECLWPSELMTTAEESGTEAAAPSTILSHDGRGTTLKGRAFTDGLLTHSLTQSLVQCPLVVVEKPQIIAICRNFRE